MFFLLFVNFLRCLMWNCWFFCLYIYYVMLNIECIFSFMENFSFWKLEMFEWICFIGFGFLDCLLWKIKSMCSILWGVWNRVVLVYWGSIWVNGYYWIVYVLGEEVVVRVFIRNVLCVCFLCLFCWMFSD